MSLGGFRHDIKGDPIGTDHIAFYSAARLINEGHGPLMYDYEFLGEYQSALVDWRGGLDAYRNPPFYALLYTPTARLPYAASYWIWAMIGLLILALGLRVIGPSGPCSYFLWACSFYPVFATFTFGQNSLLSFGIFCAVFACLERRCRFAAGMVAGLLLFKPQLLLGIVVWWAIDCRRYWPAILGGVVTSLILTALTLGLALDETQEYIKRFRDIASYDAFELYNLHTPRGFGTLISGGNKEVGSLVALGCGVAAIGWFVVMWRRHRDHLPIIYAAMIFLTLWASPHTMIYEWSIVLIPAVLLWERAPGHRDVWLPLFALGWVVLFISTPLTKWQWIWLGFAVQLSVPVLAFIAILVSRRLRHEPKGISEPKNTNGPVQAPLAEH
jgi:hypothetical protein